MLVQRLLQIMVIVAMQNHSKIVAIWSVTLVMPVCRRLLRRRRDADGACCNSRNIRTRPTCIMEACCRKFQQSNHVPTRGVVHPAHTSEQRFASCHILVGGVVYLDGEANQRRVQRTQKSSTHGLPAGTCMRGVSISCCRCRFTHNKAFC